MLALILTGLAGQTRQSLAGDVRLAWDLETDPNVLAYNLYYGQTKGTYTNFVSAVLTNSVTASNLTAGATYYFSVTAINVFGMESAFSDPVMYRVPSTCAVTLGNLLQTYDGTPKSASVTTSPPGLDLALTYNGLTAPPSGLGSYRVVATVVDPLYGGTATGTLIITETIATIQLDQMIWVYDGNRKGPSVTTIPSGLPVTVTYAGLPGPPTNAASYEVTAEIYDPTFVYGGMTNGVFTITKANAIVRLSDLIWDYDGTRKSATVTTIPPGLPVMLTYNGRSQAPYAAGSYTVVGVITDPNYLGSDTQVFTIEAGKGNPGATTPASPFLPDPAGQAMIQVAAAGEPLEIRWPTCGTGLVRIFQSTNLAEWSVLTNVLEPAGSLAILQQRGAHFYVGKVAGLAATNSLPLSIALKKSVPCSATPDLEK